MNTIETYNLICRGLKVDGGSIRPSDIIGQSSNEEIRALLALLIGKLEMEISKTNTRGASGDSFS